MAHHRNVSLVTLLLAACLAPPALGEAQDDDRPRRPAQSFSGRTGDGLSITFRSTGTRIVGVVVQVRSWCSESGPRTFTARGAGGAIRRNGSFTARGGGVAVRGRLSANTATGSVSEFQRFGDDTCRGVVFFTAS